MVPKSGLREKALDSPKLMGALTSATLLLTELVGAVAASGSAKAGP